MGGIARIRSNQGVRSGERQTSAENSLRTCDGRGADGRAVIRKQYRSGGSGGDRGG